MSKLSVGPQLEERQKQAEEVMIEDLCEGLGLCARDLVRDDARTEPGKIARGNAWAVAPVSRRGSVARLRRAISYGGGRGPPASTSRVHSRSDTSAQIGPRIERN